MKIMTESTSCSAIQNLKTFHAIAAPDLSTLQLDTLFCFCSQSLLTQLSVFLSKPLLFLALNIFYLMIRSSSFETLSSLPSLLLYFSIFFRYPLLSIFLQTFMLENHLQFYFSSSVFSHPYWKTFSDKLPPAPLLTV